MTNPLVVVVEDDEAIYEIIETTLAQLNITTVFFDNADASFDYIETHQPQLVLMDLHLSFGLKGWEAIKVLKSNTNTQNIPVIAFTAATGLHIRQAMQNGADNFLNKPFSLAHLRQLVGQYINVIPK